MSEKPTVPDTTIVTIKAVKTADGKGRIEVLGGGSSHLVTALILTKALDAVLERASADERKARIAKPSLAAVAALAGANRLKL